MVGKSAIAEAKESRSETNKFQKEQTLVSFLKIWADTTPEAYAYSDAPNRTELGLGAPIQLTFSQANRISDEIALQFNAHGLKPGDVLAIQLPNTAETPVVILAALKAGLIPCPFPILWRGQELNKALRMVPARALVTIGAFADHQHSQMMCDLAFDHLSVRFIYGLGPNLTDGVTSIDRYFDHNTNETTEETSTEALGTDARLNQPAVITWDTQSPGGMRPIYRTHRELIASGLMHVLALELTTSDTMLNPFPLTGLIGLSGMFTPSLLMGANIVQHHSFNYDAFIKQMMSERATYAAAPAPVLKALIENNIFNHQGRRLKRFGCVWQAPHRKQHSAFITTTPPIPIFDIRNLHETAVYISRREKLEEQGHIKLGEVRTKDPSGDDIRLLETRFRGRLSPSEGDKKYRGVLYVRGTAAPKGSGIPSQVEQPEEQQSDWINTGILCSIANNAHKMDRIICEPGNNVIYHGGVKMFADELDELYSNFTGFEDAAVVYFPDQVLGDRLLVAAKVIEILKPTIDDLTAYLKERGVAPYKFPEHLIEVEDIPRDVNGVVLRKEILKLAKQSVRNKKPPKSPLPQRPG